MATLLLRGGESIVTVSKRLGHAMVTLTLNVYASAMPEHQQAAADRLQALLYSDRAAG